MVMRTLLTSILFLACITVNAQKLLTIEEAINSALKNNFDILVARNESEISRINNTPGNAGMLPGLNISGSGSRELLNVNQELEGGVENQYPSLANTSVTVGAELSWTLFDGGKMFVTKKKLNEIEALGEIQYKNQVLQTLFDVIAAYYDIVRQKQQLLSIHEVMNFNQERVTIAQAAFTSGSIVKSDLLQAKIDLNVIMENAINQQYIIQSARKNLNVLLGQDTDEFFEVSDTIPFDLSPEIHSMIKRLDSLNTSIMLYQKQIDIARLSIREYNRSYSPKIQFRADYFLSQTNSSAGSLRENRSIGPLIGGSVAIPIYNAGENKRLVSTAKIQLQSAEYNLNYIKLQKYKELKDALTNFENQQQLLLIEEENNTLARENLEISIDRLRLGRTTSLEVHQAQEDYVQSSTRLIDFKYNLKIAETKLKQLVSLL